MNSHKHARAESDRLVRPAARNRPGPATSETPPVIEHQSSLEKHIDSSPRSVSQRRKLNELHGNRIVQRQRGTEEIKAELAAATEAFTKQRTLANFRKLRALYGELRATGVPSGTAELIAAEAGLKLNDFEIKDIEQLQEEDIQELGQIEKDSATPDITRTVIRESLALRDRIKLLQGDKPGTSEPLPGKGYGVTYNPQEADDIRLGQLMHEMTHVSVHEAFGDFRSYVRPTVTATDDKERRKQLEKAWKKDESVGKERIEASKKLSGLAKEGFTPYQRGWIERQLVQYTTFKPQEDYDTVLNQLLVYMVKWKIPRDNAFYRKLVELATAAYENREARRKTGAGSG